MTTVIGNLNEKGRNGIERIIKTRKVKKKDDWEIKIGWREDALTWRKANLSKNQLRRNDWRTKTDFPRKRAISTRKALTVLTAERRRI